MHTRFGDVLSLPCHEIGLPVNVERIVSPFYLFYLEKELPFQGRGIQRRIPFLFSPIRLAEQFLMGFRVDAASGGSPRNKELHNSITLLSHVLIRIIDWARLMHTPWLGNFF